MSRTSYIVRIFFKYKSFSVSKKIIAIIQGSNYFEIVHMRRTAQTKARPENKSKVPPLLCLLKWDQLYAAFNDCALVTPADLWASPPHNNAVCYYTLNTWHHSYKDVFVEKWRVKNDSTSARINTHQIFLTEILFTRPPQSCLLSFSLKDVSSTFLVSTQITGRM